MKKKSIRRDLAAVALTTCALLLVPLAAMQFSAEMSWGLVDFVAAGLILFSAGAAIVLAARKFERPWPRAAAIATVTVAAALVWAELAVGLFH